MQILFLSRWFPAPADNGAKLRVLHLLRSLAQRHVVTLVSFTSDPPMPADERSLLEMCAGVHTVPLQEGSARPWDSVLGLLGRDPRSVRASFSAEMQSTARRLWDACRPEVVISSQIDMAPYALRLPRTPRILEELELMDFRDQVSREAGPISLLRRQLMWAKRASYTRRVLACFDLCTVVSQEEARLVRSVCPDGPSPVVVPNGAQVAPENRDRVSPVAGSIIYAGSVTYAPNLEAVDYFVREVLPAVRAEVPQAVFTVTGRTDGVSLDRLCQTPGVVFSGPLASTRSAVARSWLSVAPIHSGGGTRLKVLESLAVGTPVVSTTKGVEGLELEDGRHVLIADDASSFAEHTVCLLRDPDLRQRLGSEGRRQVARRYDWEQIGAAFCSLVERVVEDAG
jgi:glycosyltransferase involved in cell wall biosynthesis